MNFFQSEFGPEDGDIALHTLFAVVLTMVKVMAPFTPFLTEHMYQNLKHFIVKDSSEDVNDDSVHYLMLPEPRYNKTFTVITRISAAALNFSSSFRMRRLFKGSVYFQKKKQNNF